MAMMVQLATRKYRVAPRGTRTVEIQGQLGLRDESLVEGDEAQFRQALANLSEVLREAGVSLLSHVLRVRMFIASSVDQTSRDAFDRIYDEWISADSNREFPVRTVYELSGLPMNAVVQIEATAYRFG
jgi:enamine deaminase RidA (YjgF/YER057c/UK114 family)